MHYPEIKQTIAAKECLSIDIGATNTVIMRKRWDSQPEFILLDAVSRQYGDVPIIPTLIDNKANTIGTEASALSPVSDFKKMLLEGRPEGREYMERYINILYQHLKKRLKTPDGFQYSQILPQTKFMLQFQSAFLITRGILKRLCKG